MDQGPEGDRDKPDVRPLAFVGYAQKVNNCILEHEDGDTSSFLMQLLESTCQSLGLSYKFETFITSFAVSAEEAKFGEIIINALAEGYHDTGFGVAVHPAGENCSSAEFPDMAHAKVKKVWDEAFAFRVNCLPWEANMNSEVARRAAEDELDASMEQRRKEEIQVARGKAEAALKELDSLYADRASMVPHPGRSPASMLQFQKTCEKLDAILAKREAELAPARRALARLG